MERLHAYRSRLLLWGLLGLLGGCPEPYYDAELGVEGVATAEGALAGTWALHQRFISVAWVPILGRDVEGGSDQYLLLERSWDAEARVYRDSLTFCIDVNHESAGLAMETPDATRNAVDFLTSEVVVDHPSGSYSSKNSAQLWALRNMPDPLNTPVPTPDNYRDAPQRDWIYDADGDGNVGCTMLLRGFFDGEDYYINRKVVDYRGAVLGEDRVIGLLTFRAAWSVLESTVAVAVHSGEIPSDESDQHPDPKFSFFEMIRIAEGAGCGAVQQALDSQALVKVYPY